MTGNRFALDTNIVSAWLKGEAPIAFSSQVAKNTSDIKKITSRYPILSLDEDTTIVYGSIKTSLRRKRKPIPENDIWIAAIAIQNDLTLVSRDGHFKEIEALSLVSW